MGLQEDINKAKKIMEAAMDDAETVSNLKELWSPLEELEKDVRKAEVCEWAGRLLLLVLVFFFIFQSSVLVT